MVGAVSLGFTAWSTYMSVQVNQDQLKQSKEQDEDKEKEQASRVTFWTEEPPPRNPQREVAWWGNRLVIVNRSLDPVQSVGVYYSLFENGASKEAFGEGWGKDGKWVGKWNGDSYLLGNLVGRGGAWIETLPPCSKVTIPAQGLLRQDGKPVGDQAALKIHELAFSDVLGKTWARDERGQLLATNDLGTFVYMTNRMEPSKSGRDILQESWQKENELLEKAFGKRFDGEQAGIVNAATQAKPLEECGSDK
ncbi:hypothetical protein [Streptomyces sp. NBC_00233]|uniref:hypothetical protein n=1 Tax=Streptomyces sp. NBC_00233 TaxID=2975686 RepID=UPI0022562AB0|nr:hypothetical protein [Streptomyces sp. NBC_00233]MCX5225829.1 hypothetical protein [Streptomyces sp. NBC_00233]